MHAAAHKPLMGVCVGMQMLLDHSEELDTPGLGLLPLVTQFAQDKTVTKTAAQFKTSNNQFRQK